MIKLNNKEVVNNYFPDGTQCLKVDVNIKDTYHFYWNYENESEMVTLMYIVNHINNHYPRDFMTLTMPYCPNARMDRVKNYDEVFTLKYFANFINSLKFDRVIITDPHSSVCAALIDNVFIETPEEYINQAYETITNIENEKPLLFYPDEGSMKRYSEIFSVPYAFGVKNRDWKTGNILGLDVVGNVGLVEGSPILIVDDICSKGGTFYHSAKKLKELGAGNIYLYITHCENTILDGELINSGLINKIFTTNSIFTKEHDLIEILQNDNVSTLEG